VRRDAMHKLTANLARNHATVVVEHLAVANLLRSAAPDPIRSARHHLRNGGEPRPASTGRSRTPPWRSFRRQLTYKCRWYGSTLVVADTFYPSSKTCSACGWRKPSLSLSQRLFVCEKPRVSAGVDRDDNSSLNLRALATSLGTGSGPGTCPSNGRTRGERRGRSPATGGAPR